MMPHKNKVIGVFLVCGFLFINIVAGNAQGTGTLDSAAQAGSTGSNFLKTILKKTWKLTELKFSDRTVVLIRKELPKDMKDIFTLSITNERISGRAAPNRYFTVYQAGDNNALTITPIASTMMASIFLTPQRVREEEYFQYLGAAKSWKINRGKLELYCTDSDNKDLIMVFSQ
ncbi:MAG: META domain-containing protein [Treponema sp.]|jgi:heat shock protein HslJ|nr:META domain-containing protein [Treponema sp.]